MFKVKDSMGDRKYVGRSKAIVIDNRDPLNRGRIIVRHPQLGDTVWIDYLRSPTQFDVPSIGDVVFVECESGEYEFPIAWGNVTKGLDEKPLIPDEFKRDIPSNRGLYTPGGHLFELDDGVATITDNPDDTKWTTNKRGIRITTRAGNKIHIAEDTTAGDQYLLIEDINGNLFKLDYKENRVSINSVGTTKFDTAQNRDDTVGGNQTTQVTGNVTETIQGNQTQNINGNLTIQVTGNVNIQCAEATITTSGATTVNAGGDITLQSGNNSQTGGVVTDNTINNDPITGIPLVGVGGVFAP